MEPRAIAALEETRQARGVAETAPESIRVAGGWACWAEPGSWQNQAMGLGMDGPVRDASLDELIAFYDAHGTPPQVEVSPHAHASLIGGLRDRGFALKAFETVLYRALDAPVEVRWPEGITVREVSKTDEDDLRCYVETLTAGFAADAAETSDPGPALRAGLRVTKHPRVRSFLVEVDGEPAGAASLEIAEPLARLIGASVLPAFRRRGIQTALVQLRARQGWLAGCSHATIQSRPGGGTERNAVRLGFQVACTKVTLDRR